MRTIFADEGPVAQIIIDIIDGVMKLEVKALKPDAEGITGMIGEVITWAIGKDNSLYDMDAMVTGPHVSPDIDKAVKDFVESKKVDLPAREIQKRVVQPDDKQKQQIREQQQGGY